jgi:hypothetical protein
MRLQSDSLEQKIKNIAGDRKIHMLALGWTGTLIAFYPGFMSTDSINQYSQTLSGVYNDHHPIIFAKLWSMLGNIVSGPFLMLLLQASIYWLAILILYLKKRTYRNSKLIILMGFSPFLLSILGVIWKDIHFAVALLFILATSVERKSFSFGIQKILLLGLEMAFLLYASNVRGNSWAAIPFVAYIWIRSYLKNTSKIKIISLALLFTISAFGLGKFYTEDVVKATPSDFANYFMTDQLIYFSYLEKKSLVPEVTYRDMVNCAPAIVAEMKLTQRAFCLEISGKYSTASFNTKNLRSQLIKSIKEHPWEFFIYKISAYSEFTGTFWHKNYYYWHPGLDKNDFGLTQKNNGVTVLLRNYVEGTITLLPFLFAPLFWLWLSIMLILLSWLVRKRIDSEISFMLAMSAFLYNFQNFLAAGGPDFRYFYWSAMGTTLSLVLLLLSSSKNIISDFWKAAIGYRIFVITFTLICIFQVQIFHHVDYLSLLDS